MHEVITMQDKTCADCAFFIQHYRKAQNRYFWVNCGHCKKPRLKSREPSAKACSNFQEKSPVD